MSKHLFFLLSPSFSDHSFLNFFFTKSLYTKFLIIKTSRSKKKNLMLLDNHFSEFIIKFKNRSKRLNSKLKTKVGGFLKADIFLCKHTKLNSFFFFALGFKTYIKKNIFVNLNIIKTMFNSASHIFFYKSVRGGFLGFSNNVFGYVSRMVLLKFKYKLLKYKKFCIILFGGGFVSSFKKSFFSFAAGLNRKLKKKIRKHSFFFKRFKFFFFSKFLFILDFLKQLKLFLSFKSLLKEYPLKAFLFNYFFKLNNLLI